MDIATRCWIISGWYHTAILPMFRNYEVSWKLKKDLAKLEEPREACYFEFILPLRLLNIFLESNNATCGWFPHLISYYINNYCL